MDPEGAARASADVIVNLPAGFMFDPATYAYGGELGFDGIDFYTAGRGGALGDVDGSVVAAAFVFFNPAWVRASWARARAVMAPRSSTEAFTHCLTTWADAHLGDGVDYGRLAHLAGRVVSGASVACAPLFAAWQSMPEPDGPKGVALHRMNLLRELRGAAHGASVLGAGLEPLEAVLVRAPFMAGILGWEEPYPEVTSCAETWEQAERATNRVVGRAFAALEPGELNEIVELMVAAQTGAH